MDDRLYRSRNDRVLTGVAGGVAERLDADPSIIRVVWALLVILTGGIALVAYVVMAVVVPEAPDDEPDREPDPTTTEPDQDAPTAATTFAAAASATVSAAPPPTGTAGSWVGPNGQTVPRASGPSTGRRRRTGASGGDERGAFIGGLILILIGGFFLVRQFIPAIDLGSWWPLILVGIGVILVVMSVTPGRKSG